MLLLPLVSCVAYTLILFRDEFFQLSLLNLFTEMEMTERKMFVTKTCFHLVREMRKASKPRRYQNKTKVKKYIVYIVSIYPCVR